MNTLKKNTDVTQAHSGDPLFLDKQCENQSESNLDILPAPPSANKKMNRKNQSAGAFHRGITGTLVRIKHKQDFKKLISSCG